MTPTHRLAGQRWFALTFVAALALAGCGDDDSSDDTGDNEDPDANQGTDPDASAVDAQPSIDASVDPIDAPNPPDPDAAVLTTIRSIGVGNAVACATLSTGEVRCWGANEQGQVGIGTTDPGSVPTPSVVQGLSGAETADCGTAHCCAQTTSNGPQCWGWNAAGELGSTDPDLGNRTQPSSVYEVADGSPVFVSGADQVAVGTNHNCVRKGSDVWCWGWNLAGQSGQDPTVPNQGEIHAAMRVTSVTDATFVALAHAQNGEHSCAIQSTGRVMCWGRNNAGQLGNGSSGLNSFQAGQVVNLINVTSLALGRRHTCVIGQVEDDPDRPKAVYCWGLNDQGQSGPGAVTPQTRPVEVPGLENAIALTAGQLHTCALIQGGTVKCWGDNLDGQLGDDTRTGRPTPADVLGPEGTDLLTGIEQIAAGGGDVGGRVGGNTCARTANELYCWGSNNRGQLGQGTIDSNAPATRPLLVPGILPEE